MLERIFRENFKSTVFLISELQQINYIVFVDKWFYVTFLIYPDCFEIYRELLISTISQDY